MTLASALCAVAGEAWLFWLLVSVFACAFAGTVILCAWSIRRGDFRDDEGRWLAVRAEEGGRDGPA